MLASFRTGIDKQLESRVDGPTPLLVAVEDTDRQATMVERVSALREEDVPLTAQASCPKWAAVACSRAELSRANIPYRKFATAARRGRPRRGRACIIARLGESERHSGLAAVPWCENVGRPLRSELSGPVSGDTSPLSSMTRQCPELDRRGLVEELAGQ